MTYTVTFYLTDISKLRGIVGGKDVSLLEKLEEPDDDELEFIETLIRGAEPNDEDGADYGYALERIVGHLSGESESVPEFENLPFDDFEDPPLSWIIDSGPPVALPEYGDYPYIGHRLQKDVQKTLKDWNAGRFDDCATEIKTMIEGMIEVFKKAVKKKKDIVTFYY